MSSPVIPTLSSVSRRKFLNLSSLAIVGSVLASVPKLGASPTPEATSNTPVMPEAKGILGIFQVAPLPYEYHALEPHIDTETMHLHHDKHYATYTKKLNEALSQTPELRTKSIEELLSNISQLPTSVQKVIRNNGGGYYNHSWFWKWMTPYSGGEPDDRLKTAIKEGFGSFVAMQKELTKAAESVFGSGWAWLIVSNDGKLQITATPNQDNPLMQGVAEHTGKPILGLDVWEHSYYLKYRNERSKYIQSWWNIVNWDTVNKLFAKAEYRQTS